MTGNSNISFIAFGELVRSEDNPNGIISKPYYDKLKREGKIRTSGRGCYSSPVMIEFDSLPPKYKTEWITRHGDPRQMKEEKTFLQRIKLDAAARDCFTEYRYGDNGKCLEVDTINEYCNDAAILNAVRDMIADTVEARAKVGKATPKLWENIARHVDSAREFYPCNLPKNPISLKRKYERYINEGYYGLIHAGYGNRNSAAVNDEQGEALLLELFSHGNKLTAPAVVEAYNLWAAANGRREITERTAINYKIEHEYEISMRRDGKKSWADKYDRVIRRERPSAPLLLINSDDNDLDLYFKAEYTAKVKGQLVTIKNDWFRLKMYVVLDAYCDYVLGYAVGPDMTVELVKEAYRNAANHVKELTGGRYLWHQIVADHWQLKNLQPFYQAQATFTPPTVGNARSKVIERFFGNTWHNELKRYNNYAGQNITAKAKSNPDYIAANAKNRPTLDEGYHQVAQFVKSLRALKWKDTGKSRQQVWIEGFQASELARERLISDEQYLMIFGKRHEMKGNRPAPAKISNGGINPTIGGVEYFYEVPDAIYRTAIGKTVNIYYDPADMSRVLATDNKNLRFIAMTDRAAKMALADMQPGDRAQLESLLNEKARRRKEVQDEDEARRLLLDRECMDAQSLLQAGRIEKEARFKAAEVATRVTNGGGSTPRPGGKRPSIHDLS